MTTQSSSVTSHGSPVTIPDTASLQLLPLARIFESEHNPRKTFGGLDELAASIKEHGVLVPLLVRPLHGADTTPEKYEIVAGARRYRAAKKAGLAVVPARIAELDDAAALELAIIDNLQRQDVGALEEAQGFQTLLDLGKYDVAALAKRIAKSASYVYQRVKLVELAPEARKALSDEKITPGHAILIARLQPPDQKRALEEATGGRYDKPRSVRELGDWIQEAIHLDLGKVPWKLDDAALLPKAGACALCPKKEKNACLDPQCYEAKMRAHFLQVEEKLGKKDSRAVFRISAEYEGVKDGVYGQKAWREAKPESCPAAAIGLAIGGGYVALGDSNLRLTRGQTIGICIDPKCKIHWKPERESSSGSSYSSGKTAAEKAKERKDRAIAEARTQAVGLIAAETDWPLTVKELRAIALAFLERITHDATKLLAKSLGLWPADGKTGKFDFGGKLEARIKGADRNVLAGTLRAIGLMPTWGRWGGGYGGDSEEKKALQAAGKTVGVDVAALEAAAMKAANEKAAARQSKPKAKAKRKAQPSAKPHKAAGKLKRKKKAA